MDAENRRRRLHELIATRYHGRQVDFVRESGESQSEVSGILNGNKSFGEKKARKIENTLGLPHGWLDAVDADTAVPEGAASGSKHQSVARNRLLNAIDGRTEEEIDRIATALELLLTPPKPQARRPAKKQTYVVGEEYASSEKQQRKA